MRIETVSCDSIILRYEARIDEAILDKVQRDYFLLQGREGFIEVVPSYASIWVRFDDKIYSLQNIQQKVLDALNSLAPRQTKTDSRLFEIPVDYTKGPDLIRISEYAGLGINEVIALHTAHTYRVYAIGFMVGFAYLGVVDQRIAIPRLPTPRQKVPKGSVAIANEQTAIYPKESAGGWNIVGQTTFDDFEKFKIGDRIRFVSVRSEE
ncbi:5-oxoprolinase subunit B family protein [Sulfurovum sp. ST-21]|uniref:Allophanate hydrolase subunit 1 n=1 Tax=Sulfurovum indicum TaxID=2779528 RepID=A0A7M1S2E5_9BACT|nr:allophanate hydrolase subunit 1 [Sulfurovum indicum]QOR61384.1 allophanate hydrolase subunit 1 [Sulfurovum indicum]